MANDDLGQFPSPTSVNPQPTPAQDNSSNDALKYHDPFLDPKQPDIPPTQPAVQVDDTQDDILTFDDLPSTDTTNTSTPPTPPEETTTPDPDVPQATTVPEPAPEVSAPQFEETPDELPSFQAQPEESVAPEVPEFSADTTAISAPIEETTTPDPDVPQATTVPEPAPEVTPEPIIETKPEPTPTPEPITPAPQPIMATSYPKTSSPLGPLVFFALLIVAGIGLATSVFLFSQSNQLKNQLVDITQTLEKQKTTITPTPTPSEIDVATPSGTPTPEITPEASISAFITPTPSATPSPTAIKINSALPLSYAAQALKVALNHNDDAKLILIKSENASDPTNAVTKYFFRQGLTTKKYFYVTIVDKNDPAINDKAIYVTPDNNIPSLNEAVLSNSLGMDLDKAIAIAYDNCSSGLCKAATLKAQYIKSNDNYIWQLSFSPEDSSKSPLILQLNATTKEILYKSPGF